MKSPKNYIGQYDDIKLHIKAISVIAEVHITLEIFSVYVKFCLKHYLQ